MAVAIFLFAITTIMAYYYIAETNLRYLNTRRNFKWMLGLLRAFILLTTFYGTVKTAESAWALGDIGVGLMAWLNVVAIFLLRKPALKALKDYQLQRKSGLDPVFYPEKLGIRHTEAWQKEDHHKVNAGG